MDSAVRETPTWVRASALREPIPRAVSPPVTATSICLRVGDWASVARLHVSFIFPPRFTPLTTPCCCTQHPHRRPKRKYVQDNILLAPRRSKHNASLLRSRRPYALSHWPPRGSEKEHR